VREWFSKLRQIFRRAEIGSDLREEMDAHFEMEVREQIARGVREEAARAAARRRFGSPAFIGDRAMDAWRFGSWDILVQDVRYAARALCHTPSFTVIALLSLAVGIGASAGIFGLMNALLWKPLPVSDPGSLVLVWPCDGAAPHSDFAMYHPMFREFRDRSTVFNGVSASWFVDRANVILDSNGPNAGPVRAGMVSGDYFATLGIHAAVGRTFTRDDEGPSAGRPVAVIAYSFWQRKFNSASDIMGRTLRLNQIVFTIVGVAPREFTGDRTGSLTDLWLPFTMQPAIMPEVPPTPRHPTRIFARLKPGIGIAQAQAASQALYQQLLTESIPQLTPNLAQQIAQQRIELQPAGAGYAPQREALSAPIATLMALAALILLAGCASVANLWFARSNARQRETAVRVAVGAGTSCLVRQALTETILLAAAGGLAGTLLASVSIDSIASMLRSGPMSMRSNGAAASIVSLAPGLYRDARVFGFTTLACMIAGVAFGVAPALRSSKAPLAPALTGRGTTAGSGAVRKTLVVVQVALAVILLCGAALFLRTLDNLKKRDLGFEREHLLMAWVDAAQTGRSQPALLDLSETVRQQIMTIPGALSFGMGPLLTGSIGGGGSETWRVEDKQPKPGLLTARAGVTPGFFSTAGTPLLAGRYFSDQDRATSPKVAILNQTMARFFFGDESPIGKRIGAGNESVNSTEIVGVVADQRTGTPRDQRGILYVPYAQATNQLRGPWCIIIRTGGDPLTLANPVRQRLRAVDPAMPILNITSVAGQLDDILSQERLLAVLSATFALTATLLACIGLYGVMAYATSRRMQEFGIRIALGAKPAGVCAMVLRESFILVVAGLAVGTPLAVASARGASAVLFGVGAVGVSGMATASSVLILVAAVAALVPAIKASRVHLADALRHD
jgi:predicted permease